MPQLPDDLPSVYDSVAAMAQGAPRPEMTPEQAAGMGAVMAAGMGENTAIADYVWLPIRFDGDIPRIDWLDEWKVEQFA